MAANKLKYSFNMESQDVLLNIFYAFYHDFHLDTANCMSYVEKNELTVKQAQEVEDMLDMIIVKYKDYNAPFIADLLKRIIQNLDYFIHM